MKATILVVTEDERPVSELSNEPSRNSVAHREAEGQLIECVLSMKRSIGEEVVFLALLTNFV